MKKVPEALRYLGDIYEERNALYKNNYKYFGKVMMGLFPNGVELKTEAEFNRFALFVHAVTKVTRYSNMFKQGGHADSLDDLSVYSQMLAEVDREIAEINKPSPPLSEFTKEFIKAIKSPKSDYAKPISMFLDRDFISREQALKLAGVHPNMSDGEWEKNVATHPAMKPAEGDASLEEQEVSDEAERKIREREAIAASNAPPEPHDGYLPIVAQDPSEG